MSSLDKYRIANAFLYGAINGHKGLCRNVVYNYAQVYYKPVQDVLAGLSIMFLDLEGFEYEEYMLVNNMLQELMQEANQLNNDS